MELSFAHPDEIQTGLGMVVQNILIDTIDEYNQLASSITNHLRTKQAVRSSKPEDVWSSITYVEHSSGQKDLIFVGEYNSIVNSNLTNCVSELDGCTTLDEWYNNYHK